MHRGKTLDDSLDFQEYDPKFMNGIFRDRYGAFLRRVYGESMKVIVQSMFRSHYFLLKPHLLIRL